MYTIKTLNNISQNGLKRLPTERYRMVDELAGADAILVRKAELNFNRVHRLHYED